MTHHIFSFSFSSTLPELALKGKLGAGFPSENLAFSFFPKKAFRLLGRRKPLVSSRLKEREKGWTS
jgi:hypothetical protein